MDKQKTIVVGGGLSGLSAAHTILERGGNVVVIDKASFFGGNSTKATSGINGAGTEAQMRNEIKDSSSVFFQDSKKSARELARDDLLHVLTGKSGDAIKWLTEEFKLDLSKVARLGGHSQPRTHRGEGGQFPGMTITYALMEKLEDLAQSQPNRAKVLKKSCVTRLLQDNDLTVTGVEYEKDGQKFTELGPVILATGGYAADFGDNSLLAKHRPDLMHLPTTNGPWSTGDGHKMVLGIGGAAVDLEKVQVHPTGLVDPKEPDSKVKFLAAEALRGVGGLLVDNQGQRFCDELGHRDYVTGRMWEIKKDPIRLILNGPASRQIEWHCKHYVGRGLMKKFTNGSDLAKEMGVSSDALKKTFQDYNDIAHGKKKDPYGKKFFFDKGDEWKMDDTFHVAQMTPVLHFTMGGVEINASAEILGEQGTIPGLFACGELAGGVHGANRLGGSSLLGCVVFGRVAGDSAARYMLTENLNGKAAERLGLLGAHVAGQPLETKVRIDPSNSKLTLEYSWGHQDDSNAGTSQPPAQSEPARQGDRTTAQMEPEKIDEPASKKTETKSEFTVEDVKKHTSKDDCWVIVHDEVLDVTNFLPEHPGGEKAIMLYAGRDATEEFDMLHPPGVIQKYAPQSVIGSVKK
ncbi:hypothetical protein E3P81_03356 [Wallemia ichthyophaga]|nr:hypothetical protein E3P97_03393 [Wallemia ichthyophaga]TIB29347.1 hypothetical protein E3P85_03218 [Wallemia ichthyophaga]TIB44808.1 hypothetical protein E3P82_03361 [Wallemia ichthyophaga]TIB47183.1 hypothetical protein E3P81_03356 [Wallemia ichthyophaga]TIB50171.1 hypothetical protein E3P80_03365 [Wallemia ichthyophaga]